MGQRREMGLQLLPVAVLDRRGDPRVKTPTILRGDLLVDRLANERVGKSPAPARLHGGRQDADAVALVQQQTQVFGVAAGRRLQDPDVKFVADRRADLQNRARRPGS